MKGYYNTTNETGQVLMQFIEAADNQDSLIMDFFRRHPEKEFTPCEVQVLTCLNDAPITSCRRAITNLTKIGKLIKTNIKRQGAFGRPNYTWKLNTNYGN